MRYLPIAYNGVPTLSFERRQLVGGARHLLACIGEMTRPCVVTCALRSVTLVALTIVARSQARSHV